MQGAVEAAQRPVSPKPESKSFESALLDEYLRTKSLRPDAPEEALPDIDEAAEEIEDGEGMDGEEDWEAGGEALYRRTSDLER